MFKQISIEQERQDMLNPMSKENDGLQLNTGDFELFKVIAYHPKLPVESAIQILEIVTDIARQNILFTRISLNLMLQILSRF
jgi:hypothetical protein